MGDEGVKFGPGFDNTWRAVGDGVEVLVRGEDFYGVLHVRRDGAEKALHFVTAGQVEWTPFFDWTPIGDGIEIRTPAHETAGTVLVRHRADNG